MVSINTLTLKDASEIVSLDKVGEMTNQAEAWQGLAYLFNSQLERLEASTKALASGWDSPAGAAFVAEVSKLQATLSQGRDTATGNAAAWRRVVSEATTVREVIYTIEAEYNAALSKAKDDFAKKQAEANSIWNNNPVTDLLGLSDHPEAPKEDVVRAPFDQRARAVLEVASDIYSEAYFALQLAPNYAGPTSAGDEVDKHPDTSNTDAGSGGAGLLGGAALTTASGTATLGALGPNLAGSTVVTPTAPVGPLLPPPTSAPLPSVTGGAPPTLLPPARVIEPGPVVGSAKGRSPLLEPVESTRSVIGSRPPASTPRALKAPRDPSVIGSRRLGGGLDEGTARSGRAVVRPSDGRAVIGGEASASRAGAARGRAGGVAEDGVVRPGGRGGQASNMASSSAGRRRQHRDEPEAGLEPGEGSELWEVDGGVPEVVRPAAPYDDACEDGGPHIGRSERRGR